MVSLAYKDSSEQSAFIKYKNFFNKNKNIKSDIQSIRIRPVRTVKKKKSLGINGFNVQMNRSGTRFSLLSKGLRRDAIVKWLEMLGDVAGNRRKVMRLCPGVAIQ